MNTVERLVLQMIGEDPDSPDVFTDTSTGMAQIRESINDAVEEIAIISGGYKKTSYISLIDSTPFYQLQVSTGQVAWITDLFILGTTQRLEQTDFVKLVKYNPRWLFNSGPPRSYIPFGYDKICLWPTPSGSTGILEAHIVVVPDRYEEDTDRIKVRSDLEWAAANYAIGEYHASRGDAQSAINHHMRYAQHLGIDMPYNPAASYVQSLRAEKEPYPKDTG